MITAIKIVLLVVGYLLMGALCATLDQKAGPATAADKSNMYFISMFWPFWLIMALLGCVLLFPGWVTKKLLNIVDGIKQNEK